MKNNYSYIHIPFCESKCNYCRFASFWSIDSKKVDLYVKYLLNEIKNLKIQDELYWKDKIEYHKVDFNNLKSIYFGWWTPSILSIQDVIKIINQYQQKFSFSNDIEISLEINPKWFDISKLKWYKMLWINRLSIWVQSLNDKTLSEIWRWTKTDIITLLNNIEKVWFDNVSIDFIIWLPYVKKWEVKNDIKELLEQYKCIKHISVYMLEEYYEKPEKIESSFDNITYPKNWEKLWIADEEYLWEYSELKAYLKTNYFNSYEISNFAKQNYECKHNKAYWNHDNIIWFWLWAHSFYNNTRVANSEKFINYYSGKKECIEKLTKEDLFLETVMFRLRTDGLEQSIYNKLDTKKIEEFVLEKLLIYDKDVLRITDRWVLLIDYILKNII